MGDLLAPSAPVAPDAAPLRAPAGQRGTTRRPGDRLRVTGGLVPNLLLEARPGVQLVFLLRSLAATGLLAHPSARLAAAVLGWALLTVAIYLFNGVSDVTADGANHSGRPIASGRLPERTALLACLPLAAAGLGMCLWIGPAQAVLGVAMLTLGWAYSTGPALKKAPLGFAVVIGAGAALTYTAGWLARGAVTADQLALGVSISLWVGLCCASKDFSDVDGDRLSGRRTWPVVLGPARAAALLSALAFVGALLFTLITARVSASMVPAAVACLGSIALAWTALRCASAERRSARRRPYRTFLATQYAVNIAMVLFSTD